MSNDDKVKYEEIYQFFRNFETNGNTMTHCSLMGTTDTFTATGKWFFPDTPSVQKQLFESIAWLYERNIFHYISERQTPVFPFIEDFDIEAICGMIAEVCSFLHSFPVATCWECWSNLASHDVKAKTALPKASCTT